MSTVEPGVHDWVVHRRNVVRSVAARVPGIDAEEATSRALEKMIRIVSTGGDITDPAPYWRRAALNEAISMTREQGRTTLVEDDTLEGLTPPADGAELDAERQADAGMLRTALADLDHDDRQILFDRHVHDKAVTDIATGLGVRPHAVTMRLRRAEERLAGAFAAAHAQAVTEPECRTTRAGMHDYLKGRMLPRRQHRLEVHMDGCADCTRAFIDVREVSWMLRDLGQHLVAGAVATGTLGTALGTVGAVGTVGGTVTAVRPRSPRAQQGAVAAGVAAVLVVGGIAWAYLGNQTERPPAQAVAGPVTGDPLPARPTTPEPPAARPAPPARDDAEPPAPVVEQVAAPQPRPADPEPAPEPEPAPASEPRPEPADDPEPAPVTDPPSRPDPAPQGGTDEPAPVAPPAEPAPEEPEAPAPEPETPTEPEPETPPAPEPPTSGPPGNPDNPNGKGPAKDNGQGPGNGKGPGNGHGNGNGNGNGKGNGKGAEPGPGPGHGGGHGNGKGNGAARTADGTAVPASLVTGLLPVETRQADVTD